MTDTYRALIDELQRATAPRIPILTPEPETGRRTDYQLMVDALHALSVLSEPALRDFPNYRFRQTEMKLARAESNAASIKVELQLMRERCAELMSQHEPLAGLKADRGSIRQVLQYIQTGRLTRKRADLRQGR